MIRKEELFSISDALYARLEINTSKRTIRGEAKMKLSCPELYDLPMSFNLEVVSSFVGDADLSFCLLFKGPGNLLLLATQDFTEDNIYVHIYDKSLAKIKTEKDVFERVEPKSIEDCKNILKPGLQRSFLRHETGIEWSEVTKEGYIAHSSHDSG